MPFTENLPADPPNCCQINQPAPRLLILVLVAASFFYVIQLWSPLRLTGDSIELLSVAASASDGNGFLNHGRSTRYWPGYPALVVALEHAGAARPWGFLLSNAVFVLGGLASTRQIGREYFHMNRACSLCALAFTALSFVSVKHFTLPLTDLPFFGLSLAAIALAISGRRKPGLQYWAFWSAALVVSIAAMLVRPIGAALFPALAMSVTARFGIHQMLRFNRRAALVSCGCAIFVAFAIFFVLASTKYVKDAGSIISRQGLGLGTRSIVLFRLHEFGEMAINIPASKMGSLSFLIGIAGAAALAALLACAYARRDSIGIVEIYLLGYSCIMFVWPYEDARFWMPVLPLILLEVVAVTTPRITSQRTRHAAAAYAALYMAMGFVALAYSTRITFSGEDFPRLYGDGHLRSTYEQYYSELPANSAPIDQTALAVLQRYAPHQRR